MGSYVVGNTDAKESQGMGIPYLDCVHNKYGERALSTRRSINLVWIVSCSTSGRPVYPSKSLRPCFKCHKERKKHNQNAFCSFPN